MQIVINSDNKDIRLDNYMTSILDTTRSNITKHIKDGTIKVNDKVVKRHADYCHNK